MDRSIHFFEYINTTKLESLYTNRERVHFKYDEVKKTPVITSTISKTGIYFISENNEIIYIGIGIRNQSSNNNSIYELADRIKTHISLVSRGASSVRTYIMDSVKIDISKKHKKSFDEKEYSAFNKYVEKKIIIQYIDFTNQDSSIVRAAEQYYIYLHKKDDGLLNKQ